MAIVDVTRDKNPDQMNGFEGGKYNILVTAYAPDSLYLKKYTRSENNICIYDKIEDASQRSSGSLVPSLLNDSSSNPFLAQPQTVVKENDSANSDGTKASVRKGENVGHRKHPDVRQDRCGRQIVGVVYFQLYSNSQMGLIPSGYSYDICL